MSTITPQPPAPTLAELAPAATPTPGCPKCRGKGFVSRRENQRTLAEICVCVPYCERCRGSGRVTVSDDGQIRVGRCQCQRLVDRTAIYNRAAIPGRYLGATLESFAAGAARHGEPLKTRALMDVFAWKGRFEPTSENAGLVLHGPVGRGKTHLLVGLVRDLVFDQGVPVRFVEFGRLLGQLKEGYSAGRSGTDLLTELVEVPVLAIDELGKGRLTDWELSIIDEIVSRRYNAMRCILATTNYRPGPPSGAQVTNPALASEGRQTLGDRVGERVWSRLREMASFVAVEGQDFRNYAARAKG